MNNNQLRSIVERIERLEEDKVAVTADIKMVYDEAKGNGFDAKALRRVVAMRKKTRDELEEEKAMVELYWVSIGGEA